MFLWNWPLLRVLMEHCSSFSLRGASISLIAKKCWNIIYWCINFLSLESARVLPVISCLDIYLNIFPEIKGMIRNDMRCLIPILWSWPHWWLMSRYSATSWYKCWISSWESRYTIFRIGNLRIYTMILMLDNDDYSHVILSHAFLKYLDFI
jgi:hypothetical protein